MGTVTGTDPLEVKIREDMAAIPESALRLTAAVVERKIPVLEHRHVTAPLQQDQLAQADIPQPRHVHHQHLSRPQAQQAQRLDLQRP